MEIINLKKRKILPSEIKKIADVLKKDGLVIFPTDTVYGLAGNAFSDQAVGKIYELKQRPKDKPFIIFVPDLSFLKKLNLKITPGIRKLLKIFWPGAVTFIFKKIPLSPPLLKGEGGGFEITIAVRIPDHPVVLAVLKEFNAPLVVTSVNISGKESPFDFDRIDAGILDKTDIAVDAGRCKYNIISTIVDASENKLKILREGAISAEKILIEWNRCNQG